MSSMYNKLNRVASNKSLIFTPISRYIHQKLNLNMESMNAIQVSQFGDPSVLTYLSCPKPTPAAGQVLIQIKAAGVNPVDTYIRSGNYGKLPSLPYIPGKDAAGIVAALGEGVTNFKIGDRVYVFNASSGSYADFTVNSSSFVFPLPDNVSFAQGACISTPAFTAYRALFTRGRGVAGETVFIHGASGGVGLAAVQLAVSRGLTVVGTAGTEEGVAAVKAAGATLVFNHRHDNYIQQAKDACPQGYDLCLEMLANVNLGIDLTIMGPRGRVCIIGSRGPTNINPRDIMSRELDVMGIMLLGCTASDLKEASAYIYSQLSAGNLLPVIGMEVPLEKASFAHSEVISKTQLNVGNIVLYI